MPPKSNRSPEVEYRCLTCGKPFRRYASRVLASGRVYCSIACTPHSRGPKGTREERFWARVQKTDGCWLWIGGRNKAGYGNFSPGGTASMIGAHRVSYELHYGPIPQGLHVLHRCDVPSCVRPDHLFLGTVADNVRDMYDKGRANRPTTFDYVLRGERAYSAKLTESSVRDIRQRRQEGESLGSLAQRYQVTVSAIHAVVHRKTWKHVP